MFSLGAPHLHYMGGWYSKQFFCLHQHISRYGLHPLSIADPPLLESLSWAQPKEPKPVTRPPLREARARQATCLKTKTISAGTATRSERWPAPLGSGTPQGAQFQGPQVSTGSPTRNSRDSRPSGTLGGNTHTGINCMHRIAVGNSWAPPRDGL